MKALVRFGSGEVVDWVCSDKSGNDGNAGIEI